MGPSAGEALLARGREAARGTMWRMDATEPRYLPNFSHGTAGIAYFLATLYQATKDRAFLDAATAEARHLQAIAKTDGDTCTVYHHTDADGTPADLYYLGVSQCCGNTGVAQFFLDLHRVYGKPEYLDFARRMTEDLLRRATIDHDGVRWVQAENRVEPEKVIAQTGFMQGAAGMGTCGSCTSRVSSGAGAATGRWSRSRTRRPCERVMVAAFSGGFEEP